MDPPLEFGNDPTSEISLSSSGGLVSDNPFSPLEQLDEEILTDYQKVFFEGETSLDNEDNNKQLMAMLVEIHPLNLSIE